MVWFLPAPGTKHYRSPHRASVIRIKIMRIYESRLFWPKYRELLNSTGRLCIRRGIRPRHFGLASEPRGSCNFRPGSDSNHRMRYG
jgi:hypothetical protein